ncbi:MAG: hypothetical protein RR012_02065 [Oscillospiraceae bacterium]
MKRIILALIIVVNFVLLFSVNVFAKDEKEFIKEQYESSGAQELIGELPSETQGMLNSLGIKEVEFNQLYNISFKNFVLMFKNIILGELENPLNFVVIMVGILILMSIVQTIVPPDENKAVDLICSLFFIIAVLGSMVSFSSYIITAIDASSKFMVSFIPIFATVIAVSGNPASAISYNTVALVIAQSASGFTSVFLIPLIVMFVALSIAASVSPALKMDGLLDMLKKTILWLLTAVCTIFTGFLSLKDILVSSADTVAVKSGKALVGTLVPIIGNSLSDAYCSILGSMSMLKNAIGAFGILAVGLINIPVLVQAGMWIFAIALTSFAAEAMGQNNCSHLLKNINSTNIIMVAVLVFNLVLIMISTALVMVFKSSV